MDEGNLPEARNGAVSAAMLGVAAMAVGLAINAREGLYSSRGLLWLNLAVVAGIWAILRMGRRDGASQYRLAVGVLVVAFVFQAAVLCIEYPLALWNVSPTDQQRTRLAWIRDNYRFFSKPEKAEAQREMGQLYGQVCDGRFQLGMALAATAGLAGLLKWRPARHGGLLLAVGGFVALGVWMIRENPSPYIDVYVFQQESCAALLRGENPYATTFTNIYGEGAYVYAPDLMKDGRVNFGYPYPPLSLLMSLPGYALGGDVRYAHLAAVALAALLIAYARPGVFGHLAALLLLFTPRVFTVVQLSWTEPFVVLLLAVTVFCAARFPRLVPYALGLFLASKQYTIFVIPLAMLLVRPLIWRDYAALIVKALVVAAVVSAPLALWDVKAFVRSVVTLQLHQPFRNDALSYLAFFWWNFPSIRPAVEKMPWLAFFAAIGAIVFAIRRLSRSAGGFAVGIALTYLAFLVLNKQAFCNYYFFVIGSLCAGCALIGSGQTRASVLAHGTQRT